MRVHVLLVSCLVVVGFARPAHAQDVPEDQAPDLSDFAGVIGLLQMPDTIPVRGCQGFVPAVRPLYARPGDATTMGTLYAEYTGQSPDERDCFYYRARAVFTDGRVLDPTLDETLEDESAAVAIEQRGSWVRIRFGRESAWVQATELDRFIPYVGLIQDSVGRLTKAWDGRFHARPAGAVTVPTVTYRRDLVQVQRMLRVKGRLWLLIAAVPDEGWPVDGKPQDLGWIPAFDTRGVPTYWFYVDAC